MVFALILNGHPYSFRYDRESVFSINAHFTTFRKHMYHDYLQHKNVLVVNHTSSTLFKLHLLVLNTCNEWMVSLYNCKMDDF